MRTFTPVMLATLGQCARRYQIEYVNNYRLKERRPTPWPPNLKALLRDALRECDWTQWRNSNGIRTKAILEALMTVYAEEWREARGQVSSSEVEESDAEIDSIIAEAKAILNHYYEILGSEKLHFAVAPPNGRPALDFTVEAPLPGDESIYAERLDGIVQTEGSIPEVLIRYFATSASPDEVRRDLAFDLRIRGTMWVASQLMGGFITTALVDVIRRKAPSVPETIQCRKCQGSGKMNRSENTGSSESCDVCRGSGIGGMAKKASDTTVDIWIRKVNKSGLDLAVETERCKEVLAKLKSRGETFCYRVSVVASAQELESWAQDMASMAGLVKYYESQGYWPRNPAACIGRSGPCPYRKVCSYHGDIDMAWFVKVYEQYPGLD